MARDSLASIAPFAGQVRRQAGSPVAAAWGIDAPETAESTVATGQLDLVMAGRAHLANPYWPDHAALNLKVERAAWILPAPYAHRLARYRLVS